VSAKTREQRIAEGWRECWGVYCEGVGWYWDEGSGGNNGWKEKPLKRHRFRTMAHAKTFTCGQSVDYTYARRFWRRRKPKADTPLIIGEHVTVRAVIVNTGIGGPVKLAPLDGDDGWTFWLRRTDFIRGPAK